MTDPAGHYTFVSVLEGGTPEGVAIVNVPFIAAAAKLVWANNPSKAVKATVSQSAKANVAIKSTVVLPAVSVPKQAHASMAALAKKATKAIAATSPSTVGTATQSEDSPASLKLIKAMIDDFFADSFQSADHRKVQSLCWSYS